VAPFAAVDVDGVEVVVAVKEDFLSEAAESCIFFEKEERMGRAMASPLVYPGPLPIRGPVMPGRVAVGSFCSLPSNAGGVIISR